MEEPQPTAAEARAGPAQTIEPSKILTPPDMEVYYNNFRIDQATPAPVHQSPPVTHRAVYNNNARRMRSVSASAFESSTTNIRSPTPPPRPGTPMIPSTPPMMFPAQNIPNAPNGAVPMGQDSHMMDPERSPHRIRRTSSLVTFQTPLSPSMEGSPLSPRGEGLTQEVSTVIPRKERKRNESSRRTKYFFLPFLFFPFCCLRFSLCFLFSLCLRKRLFRYLHD